MRSTLFKDWISTAEGMGKAVASLIGIPTLLWMATQNAFGPVAQVLQLPTWVGQFAAAIVVLGFCLLLWRSYRSFAQASRLEKPEAFVLHPTGPDSLIGRTTDLSLLLSAVKRYPLVLLDGESGSGKSALVSAGLIPMLYHSEGLLPVVIRDWGEDWVRGPLAMALDAIFNAVSLDERNRLGWHSAPHLAAQPTVLAADLATRLDAVFDTLGRRSLIIADQFDDYQATHRDRFIDAEGNWIAPGALATSNLFWSLVEANLKLSRMHLLVVTRADTASGMSCVRFLESELTATRTLGRVDVLHLRSLLTGIALGEAERPAISHPECGWHDLRDLVERDLKGQGAILMQQVRTVLLGLRQLPLLTPKHYRAVGGLRGVETLVITRALHSASGVAGGGEAGQRLARAILKTLVVPGGPDQPPKAARVPLSTISTLARDRGQASAVLAALQLEEVVRPAESVGGEAWQLDHDYLAGAVLSEEKQANRWSIALREGKAKYDDAADSWRRRWSSLLPIGILLRLCIERMRKRLLFGDASRYVLASVFKPAVAVLGLTVLVTSAYFANQDRLLTLAANRIIDRFGSETEGEAVLLVWRAPEALRQRVYNLVRVDEGRRDRALRGRWPLAHAGLDAASTREAVALVRAKLEKYRGVGDDEAPFLKTYSALVARLDDPAAIKAEASAVTESLRVAQDDEIAVNLVGALQLLTPFMAQQADVQSAAAAIRGKLDNPKNEAISGQLVEAYSAVVEALSDPALVRTEVALMRAQFEAEGATERLAPIASAYTEIAVRLKSADDIRAEFEALRVLLQRHHNSDDADDIARAYGRVAAQLSREQEIKAMAGDICVRLNEDRDVSSSQILATYYVTLAQRLNAVSDAGAVIACVRSRLERDKNKSQTISMLTTYAAVAKLLTNKAEIGREVDAMRDRLSQDIAETELRIALVEALAALGTRLIDEAEIKAVLARVRMELEVPDKYASLDSLPMAYAALASRLPNETDVRGAAQFLAARFEGLPMTTTRVQFASAYATVLARLTDQADVKVAAALLRKQMDLLVFSIGRRRQPGLAPLYAQQVLRFSDPAALFNEMGLLRGKLEDAGMRGQFLSNTFASAYAALAARLNDQQAVRGEVQALRARMSGRHTGSVQIAYAAVAARLTDSTALKHEVQFLRSMLEREHAIDSNKLTLGPYAQVLARLTDPADAKVEALAILKLAAHPTVLEPKSLIDILEPMAGVKFKGNLGAALRWANKTHGITPEQLRPSIAAM